MNFAIIGAGHIAKLMAQTINDLHNDEINLYAIASRSINRANKFKDEFNVEVAYGSYEELVKDEKVDLIYIATPHSHHYEQALLCIEHKKHILVEKAFAANVDEAAEIIARAEENKVLVTEAIWTRYMPSRKIIKEAIESGVIGKIHSLRADLCYPVGYKERNKFKHLCGGALLDLGIYCINFALMCFDERIKSINGFCTYNEEGVDDTDNIFIEFKDGKHAQLYASQEVASARMGYIYGENGYIAVTNINNPEKIQIFNKNHELIEDHFIPEKVTGYEYQVLECLQMIKENKIECPSMPHDDTIYVMNILDRIRKEIFNISYPMDKKDEDIKEKEKVND